jgi:hypothetical protein
VLFLVVVACGSLCIMLVARCGFRQLPSQQVQKRGRGRPRKTETDAPRIKPQKPVWSFDLFPGVKKRRGRPPKLCALPPVFDAASASACASSSFPCQIPPHVVCVLLSHRIAHACKLLFNCLLLFCCLFILPDVAISCAIY